MIDCYWCLLLWFIVCHCIVMVRYFFFFKQKTAYEMRISDWSSDVCSSDLALPLLGAALAGCATPPSSGVARTVVVADPADARCRLAGGEQIGRASCRERGCQYV